MTELNGVDVEAFLGSPSAYGLSDNSSVERIETHISVVFLAGSFAYKLKKRLDLAYLNFTTLDARRLACEQELTLNRRTAPTLYLEVVPVALTSDGLTLGHVSGGEVVDWVVKMARFDQSDLLSRMADRGALTVPLVETLARKLVQFHRQAEISLSAGGRTRFTEILESNQKNFEPFLGRAYPPDLINRLAASYVAELESVAGLIDERRAAGWVRHCHGDLHLNNIVCLEGEPVPFDCIEFNDQFARIDILYDLAFLLMDLVFRAKQHHLFSSHANAALNAYLQKQSPDELPETLKGMTALPFFMSLRAGVRSHVTARMTSKTSSDAASLSALACAYAELANELLQPTEAKLYAIGGLSGTGKTTIAKALAPELGGTVGAVHLRTDIIRKRLAGVADTDRLPSSAYSQAASDQVYAEMARLAGCALDAGQVVVCDAVFAKRAERTQIADIAKTRAVPFFGIWLTSPTGVLESRVGKRSEAGNDASDADVRILRQQLTYDLGDLDWATAETNGPPDIVLSAVRAALNLTAPAP